jgi:DNA-binding SARP family transcriptional activator
VAAHARCYGRNMATGLEFRILGPMEVRRDEKQLSIGSPRQRALLGLLLLRANEIVSLGELVEELWSGRPPRAAKASVHNHVAALRKLLGPGVIRTHSSAYQLKVELGQLDLARFETLLAEARSAEPEAKAAKLREALAEWRGLPLVDIPSEPTVQAEIVRLEELRLLALEERIEADLALGHHSDLVPELESLVKRHPLRERLWGELMLALYRSGRQAEALATYRRAHAALVAELAIEPGPALKELQRAILVQDRRLAEPVGQASDELIDRIAPLLPTDDRRRARAVYEYGVALWLLGERERSQAALEHAARVAAAAEDRALEELAQLRLSWQALFTEGGSSVAHLARARRARRVLEELGDPTQVAQALEHEGFMLRDLGQAAAAARVFARAADLADEAHDVSHETSCRDALCFVLAQGPMHVEEAIQRCEAEIAIVERRGRFAVRGWWSLGLLYAQDGEPESGLAQFERAETVCRNAGLWDDLVLVSFFRSGVYELVDDWERAERELRSAFEQYGAVADRGMLRLVAGRLARALVATGSLDEAEELTKSASGAGDFDDFGEQVAWRQGLALVHARRGRPGPARRVVREAIELAARSDWLNLHAETLEDLAAVETSAGRTSEASSALKEAIALYERKGNRAARERALRSLVQLRA